MTVPLWDRLWSLQIGSLLIAPNQRGDALSIDFDVEKDNKSTPNKATIKIINLGRDRREGLPESAPIILKAGYREAQGTIFSGQSDMIDSGSRQGTDVITLIEATDSGEGYREAVVQQSWSGLVTTAEVIRYCLDAMAVGYGNLSASQSLLTLGGGGTTYRGGTAISGPARDIVDRIVRAAGLGWSIHDGVFQLRSGSQPVNRSAIRLSPSTGLIGSPTKNFKRKQSGAADPAQTKIGATSLLNPGIYPGRLIQLESAEISGGFTAERCRYTGSTYGNNWHVQISMAAY
jgi:hypothetical protein